MKNLTDKTFYSTIENASVPVLVDFYADWCQPCRMAAPIVEKLAKELSGTVEFYKLDIESSPDVTSKEKIGSLPSFALYNKGKLVQMKTGLLTDKALRELINSAY